MKGSFSDAVVVAVDLPGYGGSDSLDEYSATNVLEALTEFIIAMRMRYGVDKEGESNLKKTIIVAHDWGCVLSMRLAAEAPQLADRFILTNGPLVSHLYSVRCLSRWAVWLTLIPSSQNWPSRISVADCPHRLRCGKAFGPHHYIRDPRYGKLSIRCCRFFVNCCFPDTFSPCRCPLSSCDTWALAATPPSYKEHTRRHILARSSPM